MFLLDQSTHDRIYGIRFTEDQTAIIQQLLELLNEHDGNKDQYQPDKEDDVEEEDEDFHRYDPDEDDDDDDDDENMNELDFEDDFIDDRAHIDGEYSSLLTRVAEKLMQLSITFITQDFPLGDDLHSPLMHFADVMGISNKFSRFNEAYNYTSYIAGLMWMCRFLIMEYALPSREYTTLGWPSHEAYENKGERLKQIHHEHLTQGSFRPMNRLIRVLAFGKETVKAIGRPGLLVWDPDYQGVKVKEVHLRLDTFKQFVRDGITLTERILREELFFGLDLPTIDLKEIDDIMGIPESRYSFLKESKEKLPQGCEFMSNLMKSTDPSKQLIDAQGRLDTVKVMEYLKVKKNFLRKLMKGKTQGFNPILLTVRCIFHRWTAIQEVGARVHEV